jgi:hypothetical protein
MSVLHARAANGDIALGLQIIEGTEGHVETSNNANVHYPVPLITLEAKSNRFELSAEWLPLPSIPISNYSSGIHSIALSYFDGSARYWISPRRWALGIGETLWNQQTEYLGTPTVYDASRGVGPRYEVVNGIPLRKMTLRTVVAIAPRIHARLTYTFNAPGYALDPISEQESQVDVQTALEQRFNRWRVRYGIRYMNLTAKYDDGSFADANHVAGLFVAGFYDVNR